MSHSPLLNLPGPSQDLLDDIRVALTDARAFVREYDGAVVFVTHDRTFLQHVATRIVEIDRGQLTSWPGDYAAFRRRKEAALASEALREEKFDKRLAGEEAWLRQGVKARRTRDDPGPAVHHCVLHRIRET